MASLSEINGENPLDATQRPRVSPFYARSYGGFTADQESFYLDQLGSPLGKKVLDPMAGQAYLLSRLPSAGAELWLGDVNPALLLLSILRDPAVLAHREQLVGWVDSWLIHFDRRETRREELQYTDEWVSDQIRADLLRYRSEAGLNDGLTPFADEFWLLPLEQQFAAALPVLAARELVCFRSSDNKTWLKKGGLARTNGIFRPVSAAIRRWEQWASDEQRHHHVRCTAAGRVHHRLMNIELGRLADCPTVDAIITSPPYANRLDYSRMWAPELEVLAALYGTESSTVKTEQVGSIVVRGKSISQEEERALPDRITEALEAIKSDLEHHASRRYYYPFFRNYAVSLRRSLRNMASVLGPNGSIIVFVRDTVRKDVLFPTGELVHHVLAKELGLEPVDRQKRIIRNHVGLLRKASTTGMYGLAQQEWWLSYARRGTSESKT